MHVSAATKAWALLENYLWRYRSADPIDCARKQTHPGRGFNLYRVHVKGFQSNSLLLKNRSVCAIVAYEGMRVMVGRGVSTAFHQQRGSELRLILAMSNRMVVLDRIAYAALRQCTCI